MNLYLIAMIDEAKDLIEGSKLIFDKPFNLYQKDNNLIAITRVGKVNASFVFSYLINKYQFNKVFNIGFVGALGNFKIGEIYQVEKAKYHDFDATAFGYEHGQVPGLPAEFKSKNVGVYPLAMLLTGDTFLTKKISENCLIDMEGTALFQVAYLNNIDLVSIKVVSDVIGSKNHLEEYRNFELIGSKIIKEIYEVLENHFRR